MPQLCLVWASPRRRGQKDAGEVVDPAEGKNTCGPHFSEKFKKFRRFLLIIELLKHTTMLVSNHSLVVMSFTYLSMKHLKTCD